MPHINICCTLTGSPVQAVEAENDRRWALTPEHMQASTNGTLEDRFAHLQPGRHETVSLPEGDTAPLLLLVRTEARWDLRGAPDT